MASALATRHITGSLDNSGAVGTTVASITVYHMSDGSVQYIRANGQRVRLVGPMVQKLMEDILHLKLVGDSTP